MIISPVLPPVIVIPLVLLMLAGFVYGTLRFDSSTAQKAVMLITGILLCACLFTVNLRIMRPDPDAAYSRPDIDVLFVMDTSISMWASDYQGGTRYAGAVDTCRYIMSELDGISFSFVAFDDSDNVMLPLTQDTQSVTDALEAVREKSQYYARGSSMNCAYDSMKKMLDHMRTEDGHKSIVFFLSDGEITSDEKLRSFSELSPGISGGAVLGFGTEKGAAMLDGDGYPVRDHQTYKDAISCLDEKNLRQIASDLNIDYIHVQQKKDVDMIITQALRETADITDLKKGTDNYEDTYYYLIPPILILVMIEAFFFRPRLWRF